LRGRRDLACGLIHARTLEALEELGITDRPHRAGHIVPTFTIRDRDRVLAAIRFDRLPTRYPYTLMVPQQVTEAILLERLQELGRRECRDAKNAE
jgi:2-polyprenyl-6-methoxyphenol hydroxylase-like FAD-dependent oxidoreductase